jgi:hypothetical protein
MSHSKAGLLIFRFSMKATSRKLRSRRSGNRGTEIEDKGDDFIYEFIIFKNSKLIIIYKNLILTNNNFFFLKLIHIGLLAIVWLTAFLHSIAISLYL